MLDFNFLIFLKFIYYFFVDFFGFYFYFFVRFFLDFWNLFLFFFFFVIFCRYLDFSPGKIQVAKSVQVGAGSSKLDPIF